MLALFADSRGFVGKNAPVMYVYFYTRTNEVGNARHDYVYVMTRTAVADVRVRVADVRVRTRYLPVVLCCVPE